MSIPGYKNGVAIQVVYQAAKAATGKTIAMDVYDELGALDGAKSVVAMTEVGVTGRYVASWTPDAEGDWVVQMEDSVSGKGDVVKHYTVIGHDLNTVVDAIDLLESPAMVG